MKRIAAALAVLVLAAITVSACSSSTGAAAKPQLAVTGAYVPQPPLQDMAAGYFTITNFVNATTVDVRNSAGVVNDTKNGTISWNVKYPVNPELRAINNTPLAGAARSATSWYQSVIGGDAQSQCRPYVLVQITDGFDTC